MLLLKPRAPEEDAFVERLKANGKDVTLNTSPEKTHLSVLEPGTPAAISWMAKLVRR